MKRGLPLGPHEGLREHLFDPSQLAFIDRNVVLQVAPPDARRYGEMLERFVVALQIVQLLGECVAEDMRARSSTSGRASSRCSSAT